MTESGTYTIKPIEYPEGIKGLKVQRALSDYLYVEFRQPIGWDSSSWPEISEGAYFHINRYSNGTYAIDSTYVHNDNYDPVLRVGESFLDPATGHILSVDQLTPETGGNNGSLQLTVELSDMEFIPPTVSVQSPVYD